MGDQSGAAMMRITVRDAIRILDRTGPLTVKELSVEFGSDAKRMRKACDDWQRRGIMTHDSSKPARYFFRPLEDIGRDEIGKLSKPINRDPTEEEIWGPGGLAEQERLKRPEQPSRIDAVDVKLIMMPPGIGKLLGMQ
jgi:hypothetical protein